MTKFIFDFETMSSLDLPSVGVHNYLDDPRANIVCLTYKVGLQGETKLWLPGMSAPSIPHDPRFYAFNVVFDWHVWNKIGVKKYGFPPLPLYKCEDVMALCGRYTFPQQFDMACRAINSKFFKIKGAKKLMKLYHLPGYILDNQEETQFLLYALRDTDALAEMIQRLPADRLEPAEYKIWYLTQILNERGLPIDYPSVCAIERATRYDMAREMDNLFYLTGGAVTTIGQIKKIRTFCAAFGYDLPNLQAATVEKVLADPEVPDVVRRVLELRQATGKSSVAKFTALHNLTHKNRIYGNLRYYGASTGRFSGSGFQAHNLPRQQSKSPIDDLCELVAIDSEVKEFGSLEEPLNGRTINQAKGLIRAMIKAPKGKKLVVADFAGIENRVLFWVAGETEALDKIRKGMDIYKVAASDTFNIPYNDITPEYRQRGKTIVLGAGFGLGAEGYGEYVRGFGLSIAASECERTIKLFRKRYRRIVQYWYDNMDAATGAVRLDGDPIKCSGNIYATTYDSAGRRWLQLTLPSGRNLYYCNPRVEPGRFNRDVIAHDGINPYTKQWSKRIIIPSRLTENIVQALSRDVMTTAQLRLHKQKFFQLLTVHDEIVTEEDEDKADWKLNDMIGIMRVPPPWAKDLPLDAEGYVAERYKKG